VRLQRAWEAAGWAILAAILAVDVAVWLGPRNCPACRQPRTVAERARGCHACAPES
jgi:hypothetical protein